MSNPPNNPANQQQAATANPGTSANQPQTAPVNSQPPVQMPPIKNMTVLREETNLWGTKLANFISKVETNANVANIREDFIALSQRTEKFLQEYDEQVDKQRHRYAPDELKAFFEEKIKQFQIEEETTYKKYKDEFKSLVKQDWIEQLEALQKERKKWLEDYIKAKEQELKETSVNYAETMLGDNKYERSDAGNSRKTTNSVQTDPNLNNKIYWKCIERGWLSSDIHKITYDPQTRTFSSSLRNYGNFRFTEQAKHLQQSHMDAMVQAVITEMGKQGVDPHNTSVNIKAGGPHGALMLLDTCRRFGLKVDKVEAKYFNRIAHQKDGDFIESPEGFQAEVEKRQKKWDRLIDSAKSDLTQLKNEAAARAQQSSSFTTRGP